MLKGNYSINMRYGALAILCLSAILGSEPPINSSNAQSLVRSISRTSILTEGKPANLFEAAQGANRKACQTLLKALNQPYRPTSPDELAEPYYLLHTGLEADLKPVEFIDEAGTPRPEVQLSILRQHDTVPAIALFHVMFDDGLPYDDIALLDPSWLSSIEQQKDGNGVAIHWSRALWEDRPRRHMFIRPVSDMGDAHAASVVQVSSTYIALVTTQELFKEDDQLVDTLHVFAYGLDWDHLKSPICTFTRSE